MDLMKDLGNYCRTKKKGTFSGRCIYSAKLAPIFFCFINFRNGTRETQPPGPAQSDVFPLWDFCTAFVAFCLRAITESKWCSDGVEIPTSCQRTAEMNGTPGLLSQSVKDNCRVPSTKIPLLSCAMTEQKGAKCGNLARDS